MPIQKVGSNLRKECFKGEIKRGLNAYVSTKLFFEAF
jgi:hypothetical protein